MRIPKYRKHSNGSAFVEWKNRRWYLPGKHGSTESKEAYKRFIREHVGREYARRQTTLPGSVVSIAQLAFEFLEWAETEYPSGARSEYVNCKNAMRPLADQLGDLPADDFGPLLFKEFRNRLAASKNSRGEVNSRRYVNAQCNRIRRMFRWGVENELVSAKTHDALKKVAPLKKGKTPARELPRRKPVAWDLVDKTLPHLSPVVRAMVMLQRYTGCRSYNVCTIKGTEIDTTGTVWVWEPSHHKTAHEDVELQLYIGPQCQKIITPFLKDGFLFSPRESASWHSKQKRKARKVPVSPSTPRRKLNRRIRERFSIDSYRQAILRGIAKAHNVTATRKDALTPKFLRANGATPWTPHMLRHFRGTEVRNLYGKEGAQAALAHASPEATEIYTHEARELAKKIAKESG